MVLMQNVATFSFAFFLFQCKMQLLISVLHDSKARRGFILINVQKSLNITKPTNLLKVLNILWFFKNHIFRVGSFMCPLTISRVAIVHQCNFFPYILKCNTLKTSVNHLSRTLRTCCDDSQYLTFLQGSFTNGKRAWRGSGKYQGLKYRSDEKAHFFKVDFDIYRIFRIIKGKNFI